ncbi:hypothetical protein FQA39_LY07685 [Lamprigera yunnana]|nr:hypothetical protein FQA39_LY07685 [Lamprigera yunnana]
MSESNFHQITVHQNGSFTPKSLDYVPHPKGVGYEFFETMKKNEDKTFLIDAFTGVQKTYGEVLQSCVRTALKMQSYGVSPEDIVTINAPTTLHTCVPFIASFFIGATMANLDPLLTLTESLHLMKQINPKMIFVDEEDVDTLETVLESTGKSAIIVVFGNSDKYITFSEFLETNENENNFVPVPCEGSKTGLILFTSGTSGLPKGVCLSHSSYLERIAILLSIGVCYDRFLAFSRLYWITAVIHWGIIILSGSSRIVLPHFDPAWAWDAIKNHKPTFMFISPYQIATLCSEAYLQELDTSCIRRVCTAGGVIFPDQMVFYRKIFSKSEVVSILGSTETGALTDFCTNTIVGKEFLNSKINSLGSFLSGISYKVVDLDSGKAVGPNTYGELRIKSKCQFTGYYNLKVEDAWDSDGWFKTGDLVYYDEDFFLFYVERLKELLKFQTKQVPPKVVESVLQTHPNVLEVCVVGVFDRVDGEHPLALVVLKNSSECNIEEKLCKYVAERLEDKYRLRAGVKILDNLPKTATGKVHLRQLKKTYIYS